MRMQLVSGAAEMVLAGTKTRVAPLKEQTVPWLDLRAAETWSILISRIDNEVRDIRWIN